MELARAMGVAFNVAPATIKRYKSMGLDLAEASGHNHGILPVPSVFILDRRGTIQFQYVNPNYKVRLKSRVLLAAAKAYYNKSQSKPDSGH
jgi:peroxiredoxin